MTDKTRTEERFKQILKKFNERLGKCELKSEDGKELFDYALNLYEHFLQIRASRDKWKKKYEEMKNDK